MGAIYKYLSLLPPPPRGGLTTSAAFCAAGPNPPAAPRMRTALRRPRGTRGSVVRAGAAVPGEFRAGVGAAVLPRFGFVRWR